MTSIDNAITWGVLGTGNMAGRMVSCIRAKGGEVLAVGSRSMDSAQRFANRYGIEHAFDHYDALAAGADVEAVYIATTNDQHFANAMACIRHGRAVLCEKPLTINAQQTQELVDAARRAAQFDLSGRIRTLRNPSVPLLIALRAGNRLKCLSLRFLNGTDRREVSAPAFTESGRPNLLDFDILTGS